MRILCLCDDASSNSLVRVFPIAKVLQREHEVTIAGFQSRDRVFAPFAEEFDFHTLRCERLPGFVRQVRGLARSADADLVLAFKPLSTSLWSGLAVRRRLGIPLVVDIEDWELGWYLDRPWLDQAKHLAHVERANGMLWTALNELLVRRADHRFVVSRFLARRFGGTVLRHGPDTSLFDPARWPRAEALSELGLPDLSYVVFTGTPTRDKGIEDLLGALERLAPSDTKLLLVGSFQHEPGYLDHLTRRFGRWLTVVGPRPHAEMPLFLAVAIVVALPQRPTRVTQAQVPGKVFEAMAMARPVLATATSDLPEILDGCGVLVAPADPAALEAELGRLLGDPQASRELGERARQRCVERYGWDAMQRVLDRDLGAVIR